tara:strand:- start:343 stop:480 length:138 start_codon:yes stop_codon:yes gene_type:complete
VKRCAVIQKSDLWHFENEFNSAATALKDTTYLRIVDRFAIFAEIL